MSNGSVAESNAVVQSRARPPGRPRGSRNRPNGGRSALNSVFLTVPPGVDVINWVKGYCVSNSVCVNVLRGTGTVSEAVLTDLTPNPPQQYTEVLSLISISGACFHPLSHPTVFNTILRRVNGDVIPRIAMRFTTMDHVVLNAVVFRNPFVIEVPHA